MTAYQINGARLGWLLIPQEQAVEVFPASGIPQRLELLEVLEATPDFLGLQLQLAEIWAGSATPCRGLRQEIPLGCCYGRQRHAPRLAGKVLAVIGMRRSGKTSLLWQELSDRLASPGMQRSGLPWISLEDERLIGSGPACSSMRCR